MDGKKIHRESVEGVEAVLERMWEAVGKPLVGYARAFDISDNDIKNWRRRGRVARQYLEGFALEHGVSLDWLLHGESAPHQVKQDVQPYGLSADEARLLESYRRSTPEVQAAALRVLAGMPSPTPPVRKRPQTSVAGVSELPTQKFRPPKKRGGDTG